jgi:hypothetical protein
MARRAGALAAIAADYPGGLVNISGLTVVNGDIHFAPKPPVRSGMMISKDGRVELGMYKEDRLGSLEYFQAMGAGPLIMKGGRFEWKIDEFGKINGEKMPFLASILEEPQARGVACLLSDERTLYLIHAEDRRADLSGLKPEGLKKLLTQLKCHKAILLAGGRYASMSLKGRPLGRSLGGAFPIGNALGVFERKRVE